jgi:hypothetical protein
MLFYFNLPAAKNFPRKSLVLVFDSYNSLIIEGGFRESQILLMLVSRHRIRLRRPAHSKIHQFSCKSGPSFKFAGISWLFQKTKRRTSTMLVSSSKKLPVKALRLWPYLYVCLTTSSVLTCNLSNTRAEGGPGH